MKKIISVLLALLMVVSFIGCGRSADDDDGRSSRKASTEENGKRDDKDKKSSGSTDKSEANREFINEDMLPEDYPLKQVPIPAGAKINKGEKSTYEGYPMYHVEAVTKDDFNEVKKFYREFYKDVLLNEAESTYSYSLEGYYGVINVFVSVNDESLDRPFGPEYKTSINIDFIILDQAITDYHTIDQSRDVQSGSGIGPIAQKGNANAIRGVNTNLSGKPVPEAFRSDLLPIPEGLEIFSTQSDDEVNWMGYTLHTVCGYSKYEMEDLAAYYENIFKDKDNFIPGKSKYPYIMNAKVENVEISVVLLIPPSDADKSIKAEVELMMKIYDPDYEKPEYPEEDPYGQYGTIDKDLFEGGNADVIESVNSDIAGEPIPEGFDTGLVPIPSESEITSTIKYEEGGNRRYIISGISRYEIKDMIAFYRKILQGGVGFIEDPMDYSYFMESRLDGVYISIFIDESQYVYDGFYSSFEITMDFN